MKVLFFARLREALGEGSLTLPAGVELETVGQLRDWLQKEAPPDLAAAISEANVVCAVNQRVADADHRLEADDEIAFFPPVTGG